MIRPGQTLSTDAAAFAKNFRAGKTQLVWRWIPGDMETPVSAYLKLCANKANSFLLESVEGGATLGRYSIIGFDPDITWKHAQRDSLKSLRELIQQSRIDVAPQGLPPMAVSGLFGYLGYDMVRLIEDIPDRHEDQLKIPDSILIRPTILAIFDNVRNMICLVTPIYAHAKNAKTKPDAIFKDAMARLNAITAKLEKPIKKTNAKAAKFSGALKVSSNMTKPAFIKAVKKAIDYIYQGEIFQVVLSQRFSAPFPLPPFELYRSLRRLNPSPFMFFLNFGKFSLVGSSPEILVRVRDETVTIRPIAGTRPRGKTPAEDRALSEDLLADPKERAEHLMLLDLGRNDIGRIAEFGSVKVTDSFTVEKYSHVMHIVSNVEGKLNKKLDIVDALFAGFPAGTVSGAPKVRAMQIIDELESGRRGYYGGGVGYFSGNGALDTCIALRTALIKDGKLYVQAGAGIVADSKPDMEYQETVNKAQAIIRAAEMALVSNSSPQGGG